MKIVTIISQSLDAEEEVRVNNGRVNLAASKLTLDKMDEYGVEEALLLREGGLDSEIVAVGVGSAELETALRAALALGADRAILLEAPPECDVLQAGKAIAAICKQEDADLVFVGGQQGNLDTHAVGPVVAEFLDWPQLTWVNALEWSDGRLKGRHDVDDGQESFEVELPVVITTQQGLNEPRYPTFVNIRRSHQKELRHETISEKEDIASVVLEQSLETRSRMGIVVDSKDPSVAAEKFVTFLREEAKVIA